MNERPAVRHLAPGVSGTDMPKRGPGRPLKNSGGGKFERAQRTRGGATKDERGVVQVQIRLVGTKGNIARSCSVSSSKVSEVFAAIETALFDE